MRIIRQNILIFAFGVNIVAVALAGLRLLGPVGAAIFHQIGSLLVLLNALRLLGFERWGELRIVREFAGLEWSAGAAGRRLSRAGLGPTAGPSP